jgi:hypothetical protein
VAGKRAPEQVLGQVAVPELEPGLVEVLELERDQVVALVLALVRAAEGLELAPLAAELVLAQLVVALRTKSVTAAHRPDLVPLLAVEDLAAAVAETTREPVAAEAVTAWEAADSAAEEEAAAASTAVAGAVVAAVGVEDGDKHSMRKNK